MATYFDIDDHINKLYTEIEYLKLLKKSLEKEISTLQATIQEYRLKLEKQQ